MKYKLLSLSIATILLVGCSQSDEESKTTNTLSEKTAAAVTSMKEAGSSAADAAMDKGQEIASDVSEKAETAAEEASNFVKKGSSKVVSVVEDAKEGVASTVEAVKEKASDLMSDNTSVDSSVPTTESMKEKAATSMTESSTVQAMTQNNTVAAVMDKSATAEKTVSTADLAAGKATYTAKCVACHGSGATGAPKLDDGSWAERKAQGMDVLVEHAVKGYRGPKGFMPAKGGFAALSDEEVTAAVAYMVSVAK